MERPSLKLVPGDDSGTRQLTAKEQTGAGNYAVAGPCVMIRCIAAEIRRMTVGTGTKASKTLI
jgi:hypothetical protein